MRDEIIDGSEKMDKCRRTRSHIYWEFTCTCVVIDFRYVLLVVNFEVEMLGFISDDGDDVNAMGPYREAANGTEETPST